MAEVAGGSGGGIRVDADADLLGTVEWAVSCVHSVVLGGGGTARLSHMACELGLDAALAFCSAVRCVHFHVLSCLFFCDVFACLQSMILRWFLA